MTSGVPQASAWNALFGITRAAFAELPKIPSAQPAAWSSAGSCSYSTQGTHSTFGGPRVEKPVELPAADDAERELGREPRRLEDRLQPVQRDQLADEERVREGLGGTSRAEDALLRADEADLDPLAVGELREEAGVLLRVGDDDVGGAKRAAVDERERAARKRAGLEARAIGDERVSERDERVEDHRRSTRRAPRRRQVEVAGVADDHRVVALGRPPEQTKLRAREPQRRRRARAPRVARPSHTGSCRSTTSTPAPRRHEITCALRG